MNRKYYEDLTFYQKGKPWQKKEHSVITFKSKLVIWD